MKQKLLLCIIFITMLLPQDGYSIGICDKDTKNKIYQATAGRMQQVIDSYKNAVFGTGKESLIKTSYDINNFKNWESILACSHQWIKEQINQKKSPTAYSTYLEQLESANDFLARTIPQLQKKYGLAIIDKKGDTLKITTAKLPTLSKIELSKLIELEKTATKHYNQVNNVTIQALDFLLKNTPVPKDWSSSIEKDPKKIFPNYQTFFKNYNKIKTALNSDKEKFKYFLQTQQIPLQDSIDVSIFMEQLEKLVFLKKNAKEAQEILTRLHTLYPNILSNKDVAKLITTTDKASIILYSEGDVLTVVFDRLIKELQQLLETLQKK